MGVGIAILIVGILVIGIWVLVELKRLKHKIFAVFLICLILFSYIGGVVAFKDKDVEGDKEFTIKATYGEQVTEQKVALAIEKRAVTQDLIINHLKENWFIYVIAAINIILIIAIIAVVRSMMKTPVVR